MLKKLNLYGKMFLQHQFNIFMPKWENTLVKGVFLYTRLGINWCCNRKETLFRRTLRGALFYFGGVLMSLEMTIFSADCLVGDKPYCRCDMLAQLSGKAVEFVERSISLAERKKAVLQVILTESNIRSEMLVPHGVFLKSMSEMLAELILMSNDV